MRTLLHILGASLLLTLCSLADSPQDGWKQYTNGRFGFSLKYPSSLKLDRAPDNGSGQVFRSANGEFSMVAAAHFIQKDQGETLEKSYNEEVERLGKSVTYKRLAKEWYVISGVDDDGQEYYYKHHVKDSNWAEFRISYPHAKASLYNPWVEQIAKSFVPFLKGDYDRLE